MNTFSMCSGELIRRLSVTLSLKTWPTCAAMLLAGAAIAVHAMRFTIHADSGRLVDLSWIPTR